jgi:hypothetical protein
MENPPLPLPPLGLSPKYIRDEQRLDEINQAIGRYMDAGYPLPVEWVLERNAIIVAEVERRGAQG